MSYVIHSCCSIKVQNQLLKIVLHFCYLTLCGQAPVRKRVDEKVWKFKHGAVCAVPILGENKDSNCVLMWLLHGIFSKCEWIVLLTLQHNVQYYLEEYCKKS